ncbi:MAG TPA: SDR family NAD(P)-dependent oxidoreductase [Chitinophagaceae bacterium]|jgi:NAD(P)-dependent dehydrogenase (short-subunit alcohol dehydrogenase family)|nr:SDR family NAD(P)-dependent oxidoreductase [Chitinophagaceae bacterium]
MKTAIVTGASGNLGQAVVKKFLEKDYYVTGTVIPDDSVAIDIRGKNFETAVVDLMKEELAQQFVELMVMKHDSIDVAVLTVGGFAMGSIIDTPTSAIAKQYKLNFETAYNVARPVFAQMMKQGNGRIFLIGSRPGADMKNSKGMAGYGLGKSLIFRLAELMNEEAKGTSVVTSVVVPSTIDTPQNRESMPKSDFSKWVTPGAIADIIYFHCSPEGAVLREPVIKVYGNS